jgi:hypothetical protein
MFKKTISILLSVSMIACSTSPQVQTNSQIEKNKQFSGESISDFLITEDGRKLVVIGSKHHFAFALDNNLKEILVWPSRHKLNPSFYDLDSTTSDKVSVTYSVFVKPAGLTEDEITFLKSHQFTEVFNGANVLLPPSYKLTSSLNGNFYNANGITVDKSVKFKQTYIVRYKQAIKNLSTNSSSPLSTVGGSVLFLGLIVVAIPIMAIMKTTGQCEKGSMCDNF